MVRKISRKQRKRNEKGIKNKYYLEINKTKNLEEK
jgi:hypothetical protein